MKNLLILVIVICAVSCESTPKKNPDGTWVKKEFYDDGILKCEMHLRDSLRQGITKNFDKKGKLMSTVNYINNIKEGVAKNYYPSGVINQEMFYKNNKLEGEAKMYYESGKLFMVTNYLNNKRHGMEQTYYESGNLKSQVEYYKGSAGLGLKEFSAGGEDITKRPTIVIREKNSPFDGVLVLEIALSDKSRNVKFFQDTLIHGKYMYKYMNNIETHGGIGKMVFHKSGTIQMKKLNIVTEITTKNRNKLVLQRTYNLVVN